MGNDPAMQPEPTFGQMLRALREKAGLSRAALAREIGAGERSIVRWERDGQMPNLDAAVRIAERFGVSIDELTGHHPVQSVDVSPLTVSVLIGGERYELRATSSDHPQNGHAARPDADELADRGSALEEASPRGERRRGDRRQEGPRTA